MAGFGRIDVARDEKPNGPRVTFRMMADLSDQTSMPAVMDYLAQQFLDVVPKLGPDLDCPPDVFLMFSGVRSGDAQRIGEIKTQADQMWVRHPRVAEVMKQRGNGFPNWSVVLLANDGRPFDVYLSVAAGPLSYVFQDELKKVVIKEKAGAAATSDAPATKPRWKFW